MTQTPYSGLRATLAMLLAFAVILGYGIIVYQYHAYLAVYGGAR